MCFHTGMPRRAAPSLQASSSAARPGTADPHAAAVQIAFTRQAAAFEDSAVNRVMTTDSQWLFERLARGR
jgi:hypothetical protein